LKKGKEVLGPYSYTFGPVPGLLVGRKGCGAAAACAVPNRGRVSTAGGDDNNHGLDPLALKAAGRRILMPLLSFRGTWSSNRTRGSPHAAGRLDDLPALIEETDSETLPDPMTQLAERDADQSMPTVAGALLRARAQAKELAGRPPSALRFHSRRHGQSCEAAGYVCAGLHDGKPWTATCETEPAHGTGLCCIGLKLTQNMTDRGTNVTASFGMCAPGSEGDMRLGAQELSFAVHSDGELFLGGLRLKQNIGAIRPQNDLINLDINTDVWPRTIAVRRNGEMVYQREGVPDDWVFAVGGLGTLHCFEIDDPSGKKALAEAEKVPNPLLVARIQQSKAELEREAQQGEAGAPPVQEDKKCKVQ
jgi:hypothetical protein